MSIGKKNVFIMGGLFFLIGTLCFAFLCNFKNDAKLEKNEEKSSNIIDRDMFGMYIENAEGEYVQYTNGNSFPNNSEYTFNIEKSYCVDSTDKAVDNVIYYNSGKVTVTSNKTLYCYLYFDNVNMVCDRNTPFGSCLNTAKTRGFNSSMEGGLYRYQGASGNVDNYVCFGTTDKSECLADTDAHMYRVIGVNSSGQVKLIKNEALNETMQWYSNDTTDITWPNSTIYSNINGNSFLRNTTYVPNGWSSKIAMNLWKYGDNQNINVTADTLYNTENAWTTTTSAKIGLMYAHDYYYAYQSGGLNCSSSGSYGTCKTSWMHLSVSDSGAPSRYEWTMSRYGLNGSHYGPWSVTSDGHVSLTTLTSTFSVRPIFYLNSKVYYVFGSGTEDDPFIIDSAVDTEAPTNNSVSINSGESEANSRNVTLTLSSTGASQMCISNTTSCSDWEPYATSKSWSLSSGTGTKTVYVWYMDEVGNNSSYVTDTIILNHIPSLGETILETPPRGLNTTLEGGLYRYQGTKDTVDNYICFGTSSKDDCLANKDKYMYRIIGIAEDKRVKLIMNNVLLSSTAWSEPSNNTTWINGSLYQKINGTEFLTNKTYVPDGWENKIADTEWKYGDITDVNMAADALYNAENAWTNSVSAKIALMYAHDYAYARQSGGLNCSQSGSYTSCKQAWLHKSNCDTSVGTNPEWIISRYGFLSAFGVYTTWFVFEDGYFEVTMSNYAYMARPVFYLNADVQLSGGTGTASDPFIIS